MIVVSGVSDREGAARRMEHGCRSLCKEALFLEKGKLSGALFVFILTCVGSVYRVVVYTRL